MRSQMTFSDLKNPSRLCLWEEFFNTACACFDTCRFHSRPHISHGLLLELVFLPSVGVCTLLQPHFPGPCPCEVSLLSVEQLLQVTGDARFIRETAHCPGGGP